MGTGLHLLYETNAEWSPTGSTESALWPIGQYLVLTLPSGISLLMPGTPDACRSAWMKPRPSSATRRRLSL